MAQRPSWTDLVSPLLLLLVAFDAAVFSGDKARLLEALAWGCAEATACFLITRKSLKGMSVPEMLASLPLPIATYVFLVKSTGYAPDNVPFIGMLQVVYVPVTVIALRRAVLGGAFRYVFAMTLSPLFLGSMVFTLVWGFDLFPKYVEGVRATGSRGSGGALPLLAVSLASGWIWYHLLRLMERLVKGENPPYAPGAQDNEEEPDWRGRV